ncbi:hypothetical protein PM082_022140 [Marasmius tenuissimus]|nr:hypothetical protein PM082_022140 [Marasmius tenuissimus]
MVRLATHRIFIEYLNMAMETSQSFSLPALTERVARALSHCVSFLEPLTPFNLSPVQLEMMALVVLMVAGSVGVALVVHKLLLLLIHAICFVLRKTKDRFAPTPSAVWTPTYTPEQYTDSSDEENFDTQFPFTPALDHHSAYPTDEERSSTFNLPSTMQVLQRTERLTTQYVQEFRFPPHLVIPHSRTHNSRTHRVVENSTSSQSHRRRRDPVQYPPRRCSLPRGFTIPSKEEECPICSEALYDGDSFEDFDLRNDVGAVERALDLKWCRACWKPIHMDCWQKWMEEGRRTCPLCRNVDNRGSQYDSL